MSLSRNQSEMSNVPRRHGATVDVMRLIAVSTLPAYRAVALVPTGRADLPAANEAIGVSLNRAAVGDPVRVARPGDLVENTLWSWVAGPIYYTAATGVLQQTSGTLIGVAYGPTTMLITRGPT